jgi:hypothetical protein
VANPLELTQGAREALARLLARPETDAIQVQKGVPVAIGIRGATTGFRWFHGPSLAAAVLHAEDALSPRVHVEPPVLR